MNVEGCFKVKLLSNGKHIFFPRVVSRSPYIIHFNEILETFYPHYICFYSYINEYDRRGKFKREVPVYHVLNWKLRPKTVWEVDGKSVVDFWAADEKSIYKLIKHGVISEIKDESEIAKLMLAGGIDGCSTKN